MVVHELLPQWVLVGLGAGALGSGLVALLFLVATRLDAGSSSVGGQPGGDRRRAELRAYLRAIEEPVEADATVAGREVAFLLTDRDVAVTFDARTYFALTTTDVEPVLIEHELPGWQLGARLPFDTPDVGSGPDPGDRQTAREARTRREAIEAAYRELGVGPGASLEEVKAAYRDRVKEVHPDMGGSEAEFKRVREAYAAARERAEEA